METKKCGLGTTAIHAGTLKNLYGTLPSFTKNFLKNFSVA